MGESKESTNQLSCKIEVFGEKNPKKLFIWFGGFVHRGISAWWDIPELINKKFWATFINIDYPEQQYNTKQLIKQVNEYIKSQNNLSEIIITGLSFWEIVARDFINQTIPSIKEKIIWHISISWVHQKSDFKHSYQKLIPFLSTSIGKVLLRIIGKLDRGTWPFKGFVSKNIVYIPQHLQSSQNAKYLTNIDQHKKAASLWLTPGMSDRAKRILQEEKAEKIWNVFTISIWSKTDNTYLNKDSNSIISAEKIAKLSTHPKSKAVLLEDAIHGGLVEDPKPFNISIQEAIQEIWRKKII